MIYSVSMRKLLYWYAFDPQIRWAIVRMLSTGQVRLVDDLL